MYERDTHDDKVVDADAEIHSGEEFRAAVAEPLRNSSIRQRSFAEEFNLQLLDDLRM